MIFHSYVSLPEGRWRIFGSRFEVDFVFLGLSLAEDLEISARFNNEHEGFESW